MFVTCEKVINQLDLGPLFCFFFENNQKCVSSLLNHVLFENGETCWYCLLSNTLFNYLFTKKHTKKVVWVTTANALRYHMDIPVLCCDKRCNRSQIRRKSLSIHHKKSNYSFMLFFCLYPGLFIIKSRFLLLFFSLTSNNIVIRTRHISLHI